MHKAETVINCIKEVIGQKTKDIQVHEPSFSQTNALSYLEDCINTGWVSSAGKWVTKFEDLISEYTGSKYVVAVNNGTSALRLALFIMGVRQQDEVIIPPLSFVATAGLAPNTIKTPKNTNINNAPRNHLSTVHHHCPTKLVSVLVNVVMLLFPILKTFRGLANQRST